MITIYNAKEINFNNNGICILDPVVKSAKITEELNGQYVLDIELIKDNADKYKHLQEFSIIKAGGQLFRLYNLSNLQDKGITIKASLEHISKDINTDFIEDSRAENTTVDEALRKVVLDSRFAVLATDMTSLNTAYFVKDKPLNAIFKTILPRWGGELKRDNFSIGIVSKIGKDTGLSIEYAKNITSFEQTLDYSQIITRMMPVGKDGINIFGESKWLESPRINEYFKVFSSEVKFDSIEDSIKLREEALKLWGSIDIPKVNYKVNFIELQKTKEYKKLYKNMESLGLGDSVIIKHKIFNVNLTARVIRIVKDALTNKILEIELGQFKDNIFNKFNDIDYKIEDVGTNLEESKKDLYTKISQTDEKILLEAVRLDGEISNTKAQLEVTAGQIASKVSEGDVKSIIKQSPNEVMIGFNNITDKVAISKDNFIIKDAGGSIVMNNGKIYANALYATNGGLSISVRPDGISTAWGGVEIRDDGLTRGGYIRSNQVDCYNVSCQFIQCLNPPWSVKGHTHSEYALTSHSHNGYASVNHYHSEFDILSNNLTLAFQMIGELQGRVSALERK